jgi:hypothetical protein
MEGRAQKNTTRPDAVTCAEAIMKVAHADDPKWALGVAKAQ